ncbi:MAG TPA: carbon monoxide dehydrogenase subunit G [Herbaspirillum sp.]|jgi:carbon monoxide dehydrogenase subunit G
MELKGEQQIALPQESVWQALNDPAVLQKCIPGCELIEPSGENEYKVVMSVSVGPIKAKFNGKLLLTDIVAPVSYKIVFEGSGGAAGFGKGSAAVVLQSGDNGTALAYNASAQVSGKLAQVGMRLIEGVARKLADEFFLRFRKSIEPEAMAESAAEAPQDTPAPRGFLSGWRKS